MARAWSDAKFGGLEHEGPEVPVNDKGWTKEITAFGDFFGGDGGGAGLAGVGVPGAQHPPVPAAQIALDINYDMLLPIGVQKEVNVNGAQRTTFYPEVEATAKRFGLAIVPDPTTEPCGATIAATISSFVARRDSGVLSGCGDAVRGARPCVGCGAGEGLQRQSLPQLL